MNRHPAHGNILTLMLAFGLYSLLNRILNHARAIYADRVLSLLVLATAAFAQQPPAPVVQIAYVAETEVAPTVAVPGTIYSRNDGIVDWRTCPDRETPGAVNFEVSSSHIGMGVDPTVWMHLARWFAA